MEATQSDALVFFGATGDLAYKQIFPALLGLVREQEVNVPIVGVAKAGWTLQQLQDRARASLKEHGSFEEPAFAKLLGLLRYVDGDYNDPRTFESVKRAPRRGPNGRYTTWQSHQCYLGLSSLRLRKRGSPRTRGSSSRSPSAMTANRRARAEPDAASILSRAGYLSHRSLSRQGAGPEHHLHPLRQCDVRAALEPAVAVRAIQITMAEAFGVEDRGGFYDATGALRDVVQNHMLQVLANLMMDAPTGEEEEANRDQKANLLVPCGCSTHRASCAANTKAIESVPGVARIHPSKPTSPSSCSPTTGGGRACRSIFAPASRSR